MEGGGRPGGISEENVDWSPGIIGGKGEGVLTYRVDYLWYNP